MEDEKKLDAFRIGNLVLVILAVFTIGEFIVGAIAGGWWAVLLLIAITKAYYVIKDYMHIARVFRPEEGGHGE